jgi:hypothetical protein
MSKFLKFFAIAALVAGGFAVTPAPAAAYHGGHWHGGGGWHGGGWRGGWGGPGIAFGFGPGWGWGGYPYSYYDDYYAGPPCGWAHVRVWRHGHWALRRAWRCW